MAQDENKKGLGLYRISYEIGTSPWSAYVVAMNYEDAMNEILDFTKLKSIRVTERSFVAPFHSVSRPATKKIMDISKTRFPGMFKNLAKKTETTTESKEEVVKEVYKCPYCEGGVTFATPAAFKSHITRNHKD